MPGQRKRVNWSAREQILSTDLNRAGKLSSAEDQDASLWCSTRADFYDPAANTFDDFTSAAKAGQALAIPGLTVPPSLEAVAASFNLRIGAGEGHAFNSGTVLADESAFALCRWAAQTITWPDAAAPDAGHARICTIVATPGDAFDDATSRNILVNPTTRETVPATCYKTAAADAAISVLAGTAAASPAPPTVPTGVLPLFDVVVPAGATDSSTFTWVRRAWRRIEFSGATTHGALKGCVPQEDPNAFGLIAGVHRVVIDGELLTFSCSSYVASREDALNAPGTAPANNDKATYLYLCGGRHSPQSDTPYNRASECVPVVMLETTVPPDALGYPTAILRVGSTNLARAACCYVGLAFRAAGSTAHVAAACDGDWVWSQRVVAKTNLYLMGFMEALAANTTGGYHSIALGSVPNQAKLVEVLAIGYQYSSGAVSIALTANDSDTIMQLDFPSANARPRASARVANSSGLTLYYKGLDSGGSSGLLLVATGMSMGAPRLGR
jgi:hypothetical protein